MLEMEILETTTGTEYDQLVVNGQLHNVIYTTTEMQLYKVLVLQGDTDADTDVDINLLLETPS
tara:strand:+ start:285 stop:473 length:189 start_codon:yes stop_codon:yes gene_type:complete